MYNTTSAYRETVLKLPQNYRMEIEIIFDKSVGDITLDCENGGPLETENGEILTPETDTVIIPPDDIFEAGFSECVFLSTFGIGTSVRPNFWVRIFNKDGKYKNDALASAELHPRFTLYDNDGNVTDTVPVGVFYTDQITVENDDIRIDCLDKMRYTEKLFVPTGTENSLYDIAQGIALDVRSTLITTPQELSVLSLVVNDSIFSGYSKKQVLELIAAVCGSFVQFDNDGNMVFKWFADSGVELTGDMANSPFSLNGNTFSIDGNIVKVTGVRIVNEDTELAKKGTDDYLLTVNENPIAALYPQQIAEFILNRLADTKYIPCEYKRIGGDPSLQLGDILTVVDNKETYNEEHHDSYDKYSLYMTERSWRYNCGGFSDEYASSGNAEKDLNTDKGMTASKRTAQLAKRVTEAEEQTKEMDRRQKALFAFNEVIASSMGYYTTEITDENGAVIQYMHDKPKLEDSKIIYTKGINGYAWTKSGWNNGNPIWNYGFDKDGNAILNQIYAYTLTADVIVSGLLKSKNGASWINMDNGEFCFRSAEIINTWYDQDGEHNEYAYKKVLELANKILSIYGILKSIDYPNLSVAIGESESGNFGAFTVTDKTSGYGDIFQIYSVISGDSSNQKKGVIATAPFLINSKKTNRKGLSIFPNDITLFNDVGYDDGIVQISAKDKEVYLGSGRAHLELIGGEVRLGNNLNRDMWFNWGQPYGCTPSRFMFGDGTEGGKAGLVCGGLEVQRSGEYDGLVNIHDSVYIGNELIVGSMIHDYPDCAISVFGNIGVGGEVTANKYNVSSDRSLKENIQSKDGIQALDEVSQLKVYSYDFKRPDSDNTPEKNISAELKDKKANVEISPVHVELGIMADEAPKEIQTADGKCIDLYAYISLTAKAVQELTAKVNEQSRIIEELKVKFGEKV